MSPTGHSNGQYVIFEINARSLPDFTPGGLQLQVYDGDDLIECKSGPSDALLSTESETITWTQRMSVNDGVLTFEIVSGSSDTWDAFGGQGYLKSNQSADGVSLVEYDPTVSMADSGVSFAANRVESLRLKSFRFYLSNGVVLVDQTPREVYPNRVY